MSPLKKDKNFYSLLITFSLLLITFYLSRYFSIVSRYFIATRFLLLVISYFFTRYLLRFTHCRSFFSLYCLLVTFNILHVTS